MISEYDAMLARVSCRAYDSRPVEPELVERLEQAVKKINDESKLSFQLLRGDPAVKLAGAMFSGRVGLCAAIVGGEDEISAEMAGYYGERLVLLAGQLGLGTCWVAGTYDRGSVKAEIGEGCRLLSVIPIGYAAEKLPVKQKMIRAAIRRKDRPVESFVESDFPFSSLPAWIRKGAEAVKIGPSAVNQQPVNIVYKDGLVTARISKENANGLKYLDLGIAKYQFQTGASGAGVVGFWNFGDGGEFIVD